MKSEERRMVSGEEEQRSERGEEQVNGGDIRRCFSCCVFKESRLLKKMKKQMEGKQKENYIKRHIQGEN